MKKLKMTWLTLLGLILPLGNIWGPLIVSTQEESDKQFRKKLILAEALLTIVCSILLVGAWVKQMDLITQHQPLNQNLLYLILASPVLIIGLCIGLTIYLKR